MNITPKVGGKVDIPSLKLFGRLARNKDNPECRFVLNAKEYCAPALKKVRMNLNVCMTDMELPLGGRSCYVEIHYFGRFPQHLDAKYYPPRPRK